jgi:hypothetical protein
MGAQRISSTPANAGANASAQSDGLDVGLTFMGPVPQLQKGVTVLRADAEAVTATENVSQFEGAFAQILKTGTRVDPATGQREISASADNQLNMALGDFLMASGFSEPEAAAAMVSFHEQLIQGGPVTLDASFSATLENSFSVSGFSKAIGGGVMASAGYGATMSASGATVNERSGSVSITFYPDSGALSVSLNKQQFSASALALSASASNPLSASFPQGDGSSSSTDAQSAAQTGRSALNGLVAGLGRPTLVGVPEALDMLRHAASQAQTENADAEHRMRNQEGANAVNVMLGFTQPVSVTSHGSNGHRATVFKRPDGSTGAVSFSPTKAEA